MPILGNIFDFNELEQFSYARNQRNKYKDIIDEINTQFENMAGLDEQAELLRQDYNVMESNSDSVEGKISTTYVDKEELNRQDMEELYDDLVTAITDVTSQLVVVQGEYEYWCAEAEKAKQQLLNFEDSDE